MKMTNFEGNFEIINPSTIQTEKMLTDFLTDMGFVSRSVPYEDNQIRIVHQSKLKDYLQRYLIAQDNDSFQSHSLVSIEGDVLCIYYYQIENDLFQLWENFNGNIEIEKIRFAIRSAMTEEAIRKRFFD